MVKILRCCRPEKIRINLATAIDLAYGRQGDLQAQYILI